MTYIRSHMPPPAATEAVKHTHFHSITLIGAAVAAVTTFATIASDKYLKLWHDPT
jgi:hypothetical protein